MACPLLPGHAALGAAPCTALSIKGLASSDANSRALEPSFPQFPQWLISATVGQRSPCHLGASLVGAACQVLFCEGPSHLMSASLANLSHLPSWCIWVSPSRRQLPPQPGHQPPCLTLKWPPQVALCLHPSGTSSAGRPGRAPSSTQSSAFPRSLPPAPLAHGAAHRAAHGAAHGAVHGAVHVPRQAQSASHSLTHF